MSRLFDGVDDQMVYPPFAWTWGTLLTVVRIIVTADNTWLSFIEGENSGGAGAYSIGRNNSGVLYFASDAAGGAISITDSDGWMITAVTKATGSAIPTSHKLPIGGSRTSTAHGAARLNGGSVAGGATRLGGNDDFANIRLGVAALIQGRVLTTTELDGILSAKTTQSIADLCASTDRLYDDSDSFATNLLSPGTGDRTSITGTADDADDPAGWVYGLGGAPVTSLPPLQSFRVRSPLYSR